MPASRHEFQTGQTAAPRLARLAWAVRHGFYPLSLACTLGFIGLTVAGQLGPINRAYPAYLALLIGTMLLLEWLVPLRPSWQMNRRDLLQRDLPMLLVNGLTVAASSATITALADWIHPVPLALTRSWPWWAQAVMAILLSDLLWYWVHRLSHEGQGRVGRWLWRSHVLHHLPDRVYVLMHPVGHPVNTAYVRVILMLPAVCLGMSKEAVFAATVLTGFQGLFSHFNVEIRAGCLNRLLMGTELHRLHHSADPDEAKNYAAVITLWDQLFGTLRNGPTPAALGVVDRATYPRDHQWGLLLAWPFMRKRPLSMASKPCPPMQNQPQAEAWTQSQMS